MLVLSRKKEEKLQIGDQITITVLRVKGNTVQLGIEAPGNVRVLREELTKRQPNDFPTGTSAPTTREAGAPNKNPQLRDLAARAIKCRRPNAADLQVV